MALPVALAAAAAAGSFFGKNKGASSGSSSSQQGFAALPPEVQQAYLKDYLPSIQKQFTNPNGLPLGQAEGGRFGSQALQDLQNYSNQNGGIFAGTTGVSPIGGVEPLNDYQKQALGSFGGGLSGLQTELPGYQNFYNENVLNPELANIDYQKSLLQNQLKSNQLGQGGINSFSNSAFGTQLSGLEDSASRARLNARAQAFQGGQNLRRMTLQDMLNSGGVIQGQNQSMLNYLQPQLQQTTPQGFAAGLSQFPQSSVSSQVGPNPGKPNFWAKLGGAAQAASGAYSSGGLSSFGGQTGVNIGNSMPWQNGQTGGYNFGNQQWQ